MGGEDIQGLKEQIVQEILDSLSIHLEASGWPTKLKVSLYWGNQLLSEDFVYPSDLQVGS